MLHTLDDDAPALDEQARFLRLIEQFTAGHLALLSFLDEPGGTFDRAGIPRPDILGARAHLVNLLPAFAGRESWAALLMHDLSDAQLTASPSLGGMMTGAGLWPPGTNDLGKRFLAFIADLP